MFNFFFLHKVFWWIWKGSLSKRGQAALDWGPVLAFSPTDLGPWQKPGWTWNEVNTWEFTQWSLKPRNLQTEPTQGPVFLLAKASLLPACTLLASRKQPDQPSQSQDSLQDWLRPLLLRLPSYFLLPHRGTYWEHSAAKHSYATLSLCPGNPTYNTTF